MSKTSNESKLKYNKKAYSPLYVQLPKELVETFKAECKEQNISQAKVIRIAIENFLKEAKQ